MDKQEEPKLSLDERIQMAAAVKAEYKDKYPHLKPITPFDLLCGMSARFLAAYLPERKDALLAR